MKKSDPFIVTGLDIGTSKVQALIATCEADTTQIIGLGIRPSYGLKKGVVYNIDATTQAISEALVDAERMARVKVHRVYAGIAGSHICSLNSYGTVAIEKQEVSQDDIRRVIESAQAVPIPKDQKLLHVLPQDFSVDHQTGIRDPIGMAGVRLEAKVHIVTGAVNAAQNIVKCVQKCNLEVTDMVLEQLASSQAVLTEDEKELGVCLLDIGGGTTDIAIFTNSAIQHTNVIPVAGDHVTQDIAKILHTSIDNAEKIKRQHAFATIALAQDDSIEVPTPSNHSTQKVKLKILAAVVNARYEELFQLVKKELQSCGYWDKLPAGVVLTGGAAHVKGAIELAKEVLDVPVRHGFPKYTGNMEAALHHGSCATGVGLIYYGYQHTAQRKIVNPFQSIYRRMQTWFRDNF